MSGTRTGQLSREVIGLWIVVHSLNSYKSSPTAVAPLSVPDEVMKVASAVESAANPPQQEHQKTYQPKVRLNRSLAALRRENTNLFLRIYEWLLKPEVREGFSRKGHSPTWYLWVEGAGHMQKGMRPSQALGTRTRVVNGNIRKITSGRPRRLEFSVYHDAAIYAEYLTQLRGMLPERANEKATRFARRMLDRREIQRWRKRVRATKLSEADLQEQYDVVAKKYRL